MKKNTAANATAIKNQKINEAKIALYDAVMGCIKEYEPDSVNELEQKLRSHSTEYTDALQLIWDIVQTDKGPKDVKAFKLNHTDFTKVRQEVEDSCLSEEGKKAEGKKAILAAMGVD